MTEVDTVMHESGAPVPSSPRENSAIADSSLNDQNESENDSVPASNNRELNVTTNDTKSTKVKEDATAKKKKTQTLTDSEKLAKPKGNGGIDGIAVGIANAVPNVNAIADVNADEERGGGVSTTTVEQECEEESQVTSSSTDIIDGKEESKKPSSTSVDENSNSQQEIADNNKNKNKNAEKTKAKDTDKEKEKEKEKKEKNKDKDKENKKDKNDSSQEKEVTKEENKESATENVTKENCETSKSCDSIKDDKSVDIPKKEESKSISAIPDKNDGNGKADADADDVVDARADADNDVKIKKNSTSKEKEFVKEPTKASNSSAAADSSDDIKSIETPLALAIENSKNVILNKQNDDLIEPMDVDGGVADAGNNVDPLGVSNDAAAINSSCDGKNGVANSVEKTISGNNGAIVDLDDSEDENSESEQMKISNEKSNGKQIPKPATEPFPNKAHSVCSDSDGAVVIGSDSDCEMNASPAKLAPTVVAEKPNPPMPAQVIDDDDDDCVVIEDDSPMELTSSNEQVKRKSVAVDSEHNSDDSQPPSKRQRSGPINQITIKDARSLTPSDAPGLLVGNGRKNINDVGIYPVNITPANAALSSTINLPKLTPLGANVTNVANVTNIANIALGVLPGLTNLNANANLLPGLTDDMFVLEAPSFIVPYIYEKPPGDSLKDIVREIESKYELTREDLVDADKSDEFDMITEQNKDEKDPKSDQSAKKKKKRRGGDDGDDSWSEETDEDDDDDDDDDSDSAVRTKVLIKEATDDLTALKGAIKSASAVAQSAASSTAGGPAKPGQENYFESPLGKFFMDIGVGLVQEFVQSDLIRLQKRKMRKSLGQNMTEFERAITALSGNLEASKKKNTPFKFTMKRCEFCNFKTESALAMAHHYETPHMNGPLYKCNFCTFEIRNATEIVYHMEAMHNIKARLIKPLPYHQCPNCGFEDNGKAKLARHQPVCLKKFRPELNLAPPNDWEAPAKIPRIKPRHGLVGTATAYQAMAAQAAAQKAALATIQQQQQQVQARNLQAAALAAQNAANKIRGRPPTISKPVVGMPGPNGTASVLRGQNPVGPRAMATNVVLPNNYQLPGNQLIQSQNTLAGKKTSLPGQPSISITPLPRQSSVPQTSAPSTSKMPPVGMKPGRNPSGNNKAQFVICEICDGYIKDLEQLRNHMQWMHEVKIHPKMIYNRPPLNCQKCQFRFFTDQGLERHLLGSHGLVTSSMQEAANKGKDAGRCPVCGRMYQWKLLNHVARDHHMTLKPAHLSYKCTVCTATFGMYKQFETHVYTAHSTVAKKAMDGKKNTAATTAPNAGSAGPSTASGSGNQRGNMSTAAANDALLKPLKINDEITIIPQPASKPRITNMESHVID